jgi:UPF0755 protein
MPAAPHPSEAPTVEIGAVGGTRADRQAASRGRRGGRGGDAGNGGNGGGGGPAVATRERRRGRRRGLRVFLVLALLTLPFVLALGWFAYQLRPGSDGPAVTFKVTRGMGNGDVADQLADAGVIDSALAFKVWATVTGAGPFESGTYELNEGQGIRSAASELDEGQPEVAVTQQDLLLPPGLTLPQIAARVGELPGKSAESFLAAASSGTIRSKYQPADQPSLEGFLFPDTYFVGSTETEDSIVQRLVSRFDEIADKIGLANVQGMTPYEAVIAASLIQTEAKLAEDAPLISAVIRNRIADGMPLQIDSTLCFARLQTTGAGCTDETPPSDADKAIDSPYNTYRVSGLPPTPISSVTEASLLAAMSPADVPYKFYVIADEKGKHAFATTLAEHERNVAAAREKGLL